MMVYCTGGCGRSEESATGYAYVCRHCATSGREERANDPMPIGLSDSGKSAGCLPWLLVVLVIAVIVAVTT